MTAEEIFCDLFDKYGEDLAWHMIPLSQANGALVEELKKEIGTDHFLHDKRIWAVAKCESNGDVLYVTGNESGKDVYYIFSLTYSAHNSDGIPKYHEFEDIYAVKEFIEESLIKNSPEINRCPWCTCNEKMICYHDEEWGVPLHDDQKQFEFLMMEVMQCGLNWNMMIQKREIFRECFDEFDFNKVAEYGEKDIERILNTEGMIRSRRKIEAVIHNAECFRKIREEFGSFSEYLWGFTNGKTYLYTGHQKGEIPARNGLSDKVSRDLKKRGMKYMGSITVYSHLQACGIINDHQESCFRYSQLLEISDAVRKRRDKE